MLSSMVFLKNAPLFSVALHSNLHVELESTTQNSSFKVSIGLLLLSLMKATLTDDNERTLLVFAFWDAPHARLCSVYTLYMYI